MELLNLNIPSWTDFAHFVPESILIGTFLLALVALGLVADRERLPWNSKISEDINYLANTVTLTGNAAIDAHVGEEDPHPLSESRAEQPPPESLQREPSRHRFHVLAPRQPRG